MTPSLPGVVPDEPIVPLLRLLYWGTIVLIGLLVVAGVVWAAFIRQSVRDREEMKRRREAALDEHYRELFENAHDLILTQDLDGNLLTLNRAAEDSFGLARGAAGRMHLNQMLAPGAQALFRQAVERLRAGEILPAIELELRDQEGRPIHLLANLRLQKREGQTPKVQWIAWNITRRRQAEEALRASEARLRHLLAERERLGRDLHDGIIQAIYAIGLGLEECRKGIRENPGRAEERLAKCLADLNIVIRDVRNFIGGSEPEALKNQDLCGALETLVATMNKSPGTELLLEVDPAAASQLDSEQCTQVLLVAREALSNALRHARPSRTIIRLKSVPDAVRLEVADDGTGFDRERTAPGNGLGNLEARARAAGGRLEISTRPGAGTVVGLEIPLDVHEPA